MSKAQSQPLAEPARPAPPRARRDVDDATDYEHRHFVNLVAAAFLLAMMAAIVWTVNSLQNFEELQLCFEAGHRDCLVIDSHPRIGVREPSRR